MSIQQLSRDEYDALGAVNWTTLKEMHKSPAHYRHRVDHPIEDTTRLAFGRAVHTAILEPDRFVLDYIVFDGERRGNAWKAFRDEHTDKTILTTKEYATCLNVRDAVRANKDAAPLLEGGTAELSVTWTDADTQLPCKARLDYLRGGLIVDVKSTSCTDAWAFGGVSARMLYHGQLAFYQRGIETVDDNPHIIAAEIEAPYDVAVFRLTDDAVLSGDQLVSDLLRKVSVCRKTKDWHGRYDGVQDLTVPEWMMAEPDDMGGLFG